MKPALLLITTFLFFGCENPEEKVARSSEPKTSKPPLAQYDQIFAQVKAKPDKRKGGYDIIVRNFGHDPISFWGRVRQQWRTKDDPRNLKFGWNEESTSDHHDPIYTLLPEEEITLSLGAEELFPSDGFRRFGIPFRTLDGEEFRKLTVWSRPYSASSQ